MAAIGAIPSDALEGFTVLGELALDGTLTPVAGVAAGGGRRQHARTRIDLSRRLRAGGRLGLRGHGGDRANLSDPARQSPEGNTGFGAARSGGAGRRARLA